MKKIKEVFENQFSPVFEIKLPDEIFEAKKLGTFIKNGWIIHFCFGKENHSQYMDYYAMHRMTDDRHYRIYESGKLKSLPSICSFRLASEDPKEDEKLEKEYFEKNQKIYKMLKEKGFVL